MGGHLSQQGMLTMRVSLPAAVGIYGVLSYLVARRIRDFVI